MPGVVEVRRTPPSPAGEPEALGGPEPRVQSFGGKFPQLENRIISKTAAWVEAVAVVRLFFVPP